MLLVRAAAARKSILERMIEAGACQSRVIWRDGVHKTMFVLTNVASRCVNLQNDARMCRKCNEHEAIHAASSMNSCKADDCIEPVKWANDEAS